MTVRAHHYGVSFIIAAVVFGTLAYFAGDTRSASAQSPRLSAVLTPASAQMTVGTSASFNVMGVYMDANGTTTNVVPATISWLPNGATVASYNKTTVVIKAGNVAKTGNLGVDIGYAGLTAHADAPLRIVAAPAPATPRPTVAPTTPAPDPTASPTPETTPTPTPAPTGPATLSAAEIARYEAMTSIFRPAASATNAKPVVNFSTMACMEKGLGTARFLSISSGESEPTAAERKSALTCFNGEIVPALLAPVAASALPELTRARDEVSIAEVNKVVQTATDGKKTEGLVLSGKGAPDTYIYLYIFSDPMIVRAQVNSSGDWTHALAASLPAGKHEIFALAETADATFVRTLAFPVEIAAATVGSKEEAPATLLGMPVAQLLYAGGALLMLIFALITFGAIMRRRRRSKSPNMTPSITPGSTVMPTASELLAAAPIAPAQTVSVESIINSPIPKSTTGSTYLPGGVVPEEYRDEPAATQSSSTLPKP